MKSSGFKKIEIDLPRQPIINQRPWALAGLLLVLLLLLTTIYAYLKH